MAKKKKYTVCKYCGVEEVTPGGHRPLAVEGPDTPKKNWWYRIHADHPNFPLNQESVAV